MTLPIKFANYAFSTLAVGCDSAATSVSVPAGHGARFPALAAGEYFYATLENAALNREIVKVTARVDDTLTVLRAQDNTTARSWNAGDSLSLRVNAAAFVDVSKAVNHEYTPAGTGAVATTVQTKLRETVSVKDFGAVGDGLADDTAAIQAAINATKSAGALLFPPGSYKVTTLDTGLCETAWFFDKAELVAGATTATTCLLKFQGHHTRIYGMKLNGMFNLNYGCLLWWYNATNSSQHNDFFGLDLHYAKRGIVYGELPGNTSTGYAQSENSIYGFHSRGIERPLYMNHLNGLLFFSAPHLVAHHEEWAAFAPGQFDYTLNRCFEAYAGVLVLEGGEVQNSIANETTGRCATIQGGEVYINGCATEVNVPFEVSGTLVINGGRVLNTQSITSQFSFSPSASSASKLRVSNCKLYRNVGVGSFSDRSLVSNVGAATGIEYHFDNCDFGDWAKFVPLIAANHQSAHFENCRWFPDGTQDPYFGVYRLHTMGHDLIDRPGVDTKGYTTDGFYQSIWYGGGTTWGLNADTPNGYYANSLEIVATGQAGYFTADPTSLATLKATAMRVKQGDKFVVEGWFKIPTGGQAACALSLYDSTGAALATPYLVVFDQTNGFMSSSWKYLRGVIEIPSGSPAAYAGFGARGFLSTVRFCGLKVRRANWNTL